MFFKKKKFYTLLDIKNQIVFTPLIFIFILSILVFTSIYFFFEYEKKNKIDNLIQSENFYKNDVLKNYIASIKYNTSTSFDDIETDLGNYIYEIIGFIKAKMTINNEFDIELLKPHLKQIESANKIKFLLFDTRDYSVLFGDEILENLIELTNSENKSDKFKKYMLRNIKYIGDNNLMYSIDNQKKSIQLSYLKNIEFLNMFLGAYSKTDDMVLLTKEVIYDSIYSKSKTLNNSHFYFYDLNEKKILNYYMNNEVKDVSEIKNFLEDSKNDLSYTFPKYQFKIFIKDGPFNKEKRDIEEQYQTKMVMSFLVVVFIALLLITSANIFGRFINTIFNRYNRRLEQKNLLFKKWKERYELAIIASNDGLWDMDLKSRKIFFSKKWLDMFGYTRNDIQDFEQWINLIHNEDKEKVLNEYEKHINKQSEHFVCEYRLKAKDGNYKWILERGKEFNSNRMLMMAMNIDERMKLTKELRDVELLTKFGRIVIFRWENDENMSVKFVSQSIKAYGYDVKDFEKNIKFFDFIYKDDVNQLITVIKKSIFNDADSFTSIHRVVDKDNNIKWVYNRTIIIKDDNGNVIEFYGYLNDITKLKMNEAELKEKVKLQLEKNLEKDRLLVQQNKLASMGEMLGNIAHQWRQPLNNINLLIYFIRDSYGKISQNELSEVIKDAKLQIDYMSQTIDDFRNFYKPSKERKIFDIKESILQSSKIVHSSIEKNAIKLDILGESLSIDGFENEFEQVIVNILNNAIDAKIIKSKIIKFDAKIEINIYKEDKNIFISIFNNCGNIDEKIIERIFEPYFTTKFEDQGTGIGLYMTKVIIEKNMKGKIEAKNLNDGVEFIIKLRA
ncbi:PAS sensor-containing two-component system histidine kinase [Arcobacter acticola]|uniref:histidine kinase n=1 Tax=Arcobacter acticola TaxID=1849015 RepID=A0A6M8EMV7_9BACT|nr:PAS domain-containing protein [Arcobacter acticola]QKE29888.1 PAS sensor-containing two-component system histidine kinase [Arcobacter acticola]